MFSSGELSTDSVVTALIVVSISALAIAWIFAGRRRPVKEGSLEQRRLAGREAEDFMPPSVPLPEAQAPEDIPSEAAQVEASLSLLQEAVDHQRDAEADAPLPPEDAPRIPKQSPPATQPPPTVRSAEQTSAMSIAAALVRHDKREVAPSSTPEQEVALESVSTGGDDLTAITGIDRKLAKEMNDLGIRYFDQIVAWSPEYSAWIATRLGSSVTNAQCAAWIAEAKTLIGQPAPTDRNHAERAG